MAKKRRWVHLDALPTTRELAAYYEAGHAVAAVVLRGPEAVDWAAILPSRKLAGIRTTLPRHRHGATKLALATIAIPEQHTLQAIGDAIIALAGVRTLQQFSPSTRAVAAAHDRAIVSDLWQVMPGRWRRTERAFRHWLNVTSDELVLDNWCAVSSVAEILVERSEVLGRQVAAEVAAFQIAEAK